MTTKTQGAALKTQTTNTEDTRSAKAAKAEAKAKAKAARARAVAAFRESSDSLSLFAAKATQESKSLNAAIRALKEVYLSASERERRNVLFALDIKVEAGQIASTDALQAVKNSTFINLYKNFSRYTLTTGAVAKLCQCKLCDSLYSFSEATNYSVSQIFKVPALRHLRKQSPFVAEAGVWYKKDKKQQFIRVDAAEAARMIRDAKEAAAKGAAAKEAARKQAEADRKAGEALRLAK